ncbi:MAG TPA: hypothetical protein VFY73_14550 [Ideonella sp.]|uniref:hypothetical protein n=1 Tax=Ideonella sp. TaxID=1929293 RepID=UPI002E32E3C6|nr:hypothetical protein [Ideonella sp.]HEX5685240.1 hypothetical protein [Ideonella sp.]
MATRASKPSSTTGSADFTGCLTPCPIPKKRLQRVLCGREAGDRQRDGGERITVTLRIVPDEFEPHALLAVEDAGGERLAEVRVSAGLKFDAASAEVWAERPSPAGSRAAAGSAYVRQRTDNMGLVA